MDLVRFVLAVMPALGVVLGAAVSGAPQSSRIPRIGYLPSAGTSGSAQPTLQAVRQCLAELGYVDGRDIIIEARSAEGRVDRLPELAAELVGLNVDIIVTLGGIATRAAKNATSAVPIVFAVVIDPVAGGLVPDWQQPGGNLTGFTSFDPKEMRPHLEVLKEVIPGLARVAFLGDAGVPGSPEASRAWDEQQARAVGLHAQTLRVRGPSPDLEGALEAARRAQAQALFVGSYGDGGGLIAYGTSRGETGRQLAAYVDKILKGAQPGALPVERLMRHELIVNLETARSIGVTIPLALRKRADRVIQ
jgi:ABC-type uncharacterized transport system substrate-binding protein